MFFFAHARSPSALTFTSVQWKIIIDISYWMQGFTLILSGLQILITENDKVIKLIKLCL